MYFFGVLGFLYCVLSLLGVDALCVSKGCSIYKGYNFLGLSFYFWGALGFLVAIMLYRYRKKRVYLGGREIYLYNVYFYYLTLCVIIDILLLVYQFFNYICSSCLVVSILWFLSYYFSFKREDLLKDGFWNFRVYRGRIAYIVNIFLVMLVLNFMLMVKGFITPWAVYGDDSAKYKVFFSPSCDVCKVEIERLIDFGVIQKGEVALYPVMKEDGDLGKICFLRCNIKNREGLIDALDKCWDVKGCSKGLGVWDKIKVWFNLYRNKVFLANMGVDRVPIIISMSPLVLDSRGLSDASIFIGGSNEVKGCFLDSQICN